jgi:hypothetical protein
VQLQVISVHAQTETVDLTRVSSTLDGATSLSITPSGIIYITERNKHRLLVITADGIRIDSLGARGSGDYRFNEPVSVDATNGLKIYVADKNNGRVQLFDRRFQYLSSISSDKIDGTGRFQPSQLQVSNSGDLFVYDSDRHIIYVFDPFGNYSREIDLRSYRIGSDIHMKVAGSVLMILDSDKGVVHKFSAGGGYLNFIGGFDGALKIHGTQTGIWALYEDRLARFSMQGDPLVVLGFSNRIKPRDLYMHQKTLYVLSSDQLLKARVE